MNIALRQQRFGGQDFTGGGIVSKAAFRYGYFQVKAKTTTNPGWHSSFWMFAGNGATTYAPGAFTEIDDFEIDSGAPDVISMGMLDWSQGKAVASKRCNANYKPGWSTAAGYHTYGLEWTEQADHVLPRRLQNLQSALSAYPIYPRPAQHLAYRHRVFAGYRSQGSFFLGKLCPGSVLYP